MHRSFSIPKELVDEARKAAPVELAHNLNGLVTLALREFVEARRRENFEAAMAKMAADPAIKIESAKIAREFEGSELDRL